MQEVILVNLKIVLLYVADNYKPMIKMLTDFRLTFFFGINLVDQHHFFQSYVVFNDDNDDAIRISVCTWFQSYNDLKLANFILNIL